MKHLSQTEMEILLRWFIYNASREQLDKAREEMPTYFRRAWHQLVMHQSSTEESRNG